MPDLLTHALVNSVLPAGRLRRRELAVFVFGGAFPDLASRTPAILMSRLLQPGLDEAGLSWLIQGCTALHVPVGFLALSVALTAALPAFLLGGLSRRRMALLVALGGLVHLGTDVMQEHLKPAYRYLFPLSMRPLELGWFDADLGFLSWPVLLPLAVWAIRRAPAD